MVLAAMNLFARQLQEKGSKMSTPLSADLLTPQEMFPRPESKGGRPRKIKPDSQAK
jgi:hypothetical protein